MRMPSRLSVWYCRSLDKWQFSAETCSECMRFFWNEGCEGCSLESLFRVVRQFHDDEVDFQRRIVVPRGSLLVNGERGI